jgi:hypothetical protein
MRAWLCAIAVLGMSACSPAAGGAASPTASAGTTTAPTVSTAGTVTRPGSCHAGDGGFLPDGTCTPGATDSRVSQADIASTICRSGYTATIRPPVSVTEPIKRERMAAYGVSAPLSAYELDHLIPLELGGASTTANLWPEPLTGTRGAQRKDDLENALRSQVCSGAVPLAVAQLAIASNWESAYQTFVGSPSLLNAGRGADGPAVGLVT